MKKILLITLEYPPQKGGIATYLYNIYGNSSRDELIVLAPHAQGTEVFDSRERYKIYRRSMNVWWAWPRWRIIGWHIISIWFRERFTEIHISHVLPVGYITFVFWKVFKIPYRVYTHGMDILLPKKSAWKKFWLKIILRNAREVIANSNFTKNEILKLEIKTERVKVLYPCITPPKLFSNSHELENSLMGKYRLLNKKIILSVGRLVPRKGFDKVIEAMPKVLQEVPNAVYVIVGNGPDKERLHNIFFEQSREAYNQKIIFISNVSDAELSAWYNACDLFAMPARQIGGDVEGFGMVFLEAALHGKPSIGGRSGGIPEAIEDGKTGVLVNPENVDEITKTLIQLLRDDTLRAELGRAANARAKEKFICKTENHNLP